MGAFCHQPRLVPIRTSEMAIKTAEQLTNSVIYPRTTASSSFPLFSQLPPELRLKIWRLNLPKTRLISIRCGVSTSSLYHRQYCTTTATVMGCISDAPTPVNLHVCAESRSDALKTFQRSFGFARTSGHIMFNFDSDILYFGPREGYMAADAQFHTCMSMCDPAQLALVRRIAINDSLFWAEGTYNSMTAASLTVAVVRQLAMRMPLLEKIFFVPREEDEPNEGMITEERMNLQIQMAIRAVCQQLPSWRPPPFKMLSLRELLASCE